MEYLKEFQGQEIQAQKSGAELILSSDSLIKKFFKDFEENVDPRINSKNKEDEWIREALTHMLL